MTVFCHIVSTDAMQLNAYTLWLMCLVCLKMLRSFSKIRLYLCQDIINNNLPCCKISILLIETIVNTQKNGFEISTWLTSQKYPSWTVMVK